MSPLFKKSFTVIIYLQFNYMRSVCNRGEADSNGSLPDTLTKNQLPAVSDGRQIWTAPEKIEEVLRELHQELKLSRSLQSDTCHLDPDNPDKCL